MEQKSLPVSVIRLTKEIHELAGRLYDKTELLDKVAGKIGADAVYDTLTLLSAVETLQDAAMVLGERFGAPGFQKQSVSEHVVAEQPAYTEPDRATTAPPATEITTSEPASFNSDEGLNTIRRYFFTHTRDPLAWGQLGEHLRKNNIITPETDEQLATYVVEHLTDIQRQIKEHHGVAGCWTNYRGAWVFTSPKVAELPRATTAPLAPPAATEQLIDQPPTPPAPSAPSAEAPRFDLLPSLVATIQTVPPKGNYARFNSSLKYLQQSRGLSAEEAETTLLALIAAEKLFSFRTKGVRHVTPDRTLAEQLHTEHLKRSTHVDKTEGESHRDNLEAAAAVIKTLLAPRPRFEQAMTYKDLAEEVSYPIDTIKAAVSYLKSIGYVTLEHESLNKNNRRTATQKVLRVRLTGRDIKNTLKNKSLQEISRLLPSS